MVNKKEKHIGDYIEENFEFLFPHLKLIKREYYIKSIGYADFYGVEKGTNKIFIIELKINSNNPNQQLISYRRGIMKQLNIVNEDNVILIGINEKINIDIVIPDIIYYEFIEGDIKLKSKCFK